MKKYTLLLPIICFLSCTKTVVRNFYTPVHDTLYKVAPFVLQSTDTVVKTDVTSDTTIMVKHDTLIITKTYTDSVKIIDTIYSYGFIPDYKGDSNTVSIYTDPAQPAYITTMRVADLTSYNPNNPEGYDRYFDGVPVNNKITLPSYPLAVVIIQFRGMTKGVFPDLVGFEDSHRIENRIRYEGTADGQARFQYVDVSSIFTIEIN